MTVKEYMELPITDEMEQVVIFSGTISHEKKEWAGHAYNIPESYRNKELDFISAMGKERIELYHLNKYGWTELWLSEE